VEHAWILDGKKEIPLTICALGGSIGNTEERNNCRSYRSPFAEEAKNLGEKAKGKIVLSIIARWTQRRYQTMEAYGGAVDQRGGGAIEAARVGGGRRTCPFDVSAIDDVPHTGAMHYNDSIAENSFGCSEHRRGKLSERNAERRERTFASRSP